MFKANTKNTRMVLILLSWYFRPKFSISIGDFEQVNNAGYRLPLLP